MIEILQAKMSLVEKLENWYSGQCNENWEHHCGISIESLDNPGWLVTIDLKGTQLEEKHFDKIQNERTKTNWIDCQVEERKLKGAGGSFNLVEILEIFLRGQKAN